MLPGRMSPAESQGFEGSGARSSNEDPHSSSPLSAEALASRVREAESEPRETSEARSIGSAELQEHDHHIAQAAFVLFTEGLQFDWEQMSMNQQDLYHAMVGRYLRNLHDKD